MNRLLIILALLAAWPAHAAELVCSNSAVFPIPDNLLFLYVDQMPVGCKPPAFINPGGPPASWVRVPSGTPSFPANACQSGRDHWPARWEDGKWVCHTEDAR